MTALSLTERQYLQSVDIDPAQVGDVVGVGAQNVVRAYACNGEDGSKVVKMPLYQVWRGMYSQTVGRLLGQDYDTVHRELELCEKHFAPYMVETEIQSDSTKKHFCVVQEALKDVQPVTPELCRSHPVLQEQLTDIMQRNRTMMEEDRMWFDAMGWHMGKFGRFLATGRPYLENVVADSAGEHLKLFDYGLFPVPQHARHFRWYYRMLLSAQRSNMRGYGEEFA